MTLLLAIALLGAQTVHHRGTEAQRVVEGSSVAAARQEQEASAVSRFTGKPVVAAEIFVEGTATEDTAVRDLIEIRPGEPLSMADVRETIAHLFSLGRYQDIQVEAFEASGGVRVRFNLEPIHAVRRVEFSGDVALSEGMLRRAVTERFGATPSVGRASDVAHLLQQVYNERGYLNAAIRPTVEVLHNPDRTILTFEVNAGPLARIGEVNLEGNPGETRDAFLRRVRAESGRVYERVEIDERLADFIDRQRRQEHYEASASHRTDYVSDDGRTVNLTVVVDRGPLVKVQFTGDPLPQDRLGELVPVRREGSVDIDLIEDSERRIVEFLNQQGYWKASVTSSRQETDGRLDIVFNVRRGLQYHVEGSVEVRGNKALSIEELRPSLLRLNPGDLFVEANLNAAASGVRGVYLRRGFAQVNVEPGANELNPSDSDGRVKPAIVVTEGPLVRIGNVSFEGNRAIAEAELRKEIRSTTAQPYYEPSVVQDREALLVTFRNRGFAAATVEVVPSLSQDASRIDLAFRIAEGPQTIVDHILIVGNVRTDTAVIEREVQFNSGQPLGLSDLVESRRRIAALGLFRRVQITEIVHSGSNRHDVLITVEEAPSTSIGFGGGLEASTRLQREEQTGSAQQKLEFAPRGFFEVGRRNIGGRNRSVNLYTRLSLRPDSNAATGGDSRLFGFEEYRVIATYREPRSLGLGSEIIITGAIEQGVRSSFNFARKGVNAEVIRELGRRRNLRFNGRYSFGTTKTFDLSFDPGVEEGDRAAIERIFPQVRLSGFSAAISRDTRDDFADPTRGMFLSAEGTMAARALGGQVGYLKSYVQGLLFRRMPGPHRIVFAGRMALGLADGFPREVQETDPTGQPVGNGLVIVEDLPASERFFAGGDTTIRGFALDSVGAAKTISPTGFPRGGNAVLLLNAELRFPVWGDFGGVAFVDGGNVFARTTDVELGRLRGALGFGVRYRSPIGPVRVDVGFKVNRYVIGTELERRSAIHFSIGHAF